MSTDAHDRADDALEAVVAYVADVLGIIPRPAPSSYVDSGHREQLRKAAVAALAALAPPPSTNA